MAFSISRGQLTSWKDKATRALKKAESYREKGEEIMGQAVQTLEVMASSFSLGVVRGRYGEVDVVGIPADLGLGLLLHVVGFAGVAGKYSEHAHNFGDGALAAFGVAMGASIGDKMFQEAKKAGTASPRAKGIITTTQGEPAALPAGQRVQQQQPAGLTEEELLAQMAQQQKA